MDFARDKAAWGGRARKLHLPIAMMVAVIHLAGVFSAPADAMPTSRYEAFFEDRWPLKHIFYQPSLPEPMAGTLTSLVDRAPQTGLEFRWIERHDQVVLTRRERVSLNGLLQDARDPVGDVRATSSNDLYREAARDINRFYAETADEGLWTREAAAFNPALPLSGGDFFGDGRRWSPQEAARMEMAAIGRELMKPVQQVQLVLQSATEELRQFILLQEPRSIQTVLVDGHNGQTLFMTGEAVGPDLDETRQMAARPAASDPLLQPAAAGQPPQKREWLPLHLALWHLVTSDISFILYGIIGLCWASWRYIISRYA